jgi:hypothetical protein
MNPSWHDLDGNGGGRSSGGRDDRRRNDAAGHQQCGSERVATTAPFHSFPSCQKILEERILPVARKEQTVRFLTPPTITWWLCQNASPS